MTREEFKTVDLDRAGLLFGLHGNTYKIVKAYIELIDYDRPKKEETLKCLAPSVRRILCTILEKKDKAMVVDVMDTFSVNDVTDGLDRLYCRAIPEAKKLLSNIDVEAEMVYLFCDDYVRQLTEKAEYETERDYRPEPNEDELVISVPPDEDLDDDGNYTGNDPQFSNQSEKEDNSLKWDIFWIDGKWKQPPVKIKHGDLVDVECDNYPRMLGRYIGKGYGVVELYNYATGVKHVVGKAVSRGLDRNPRLISDEKLFEFIED